MSTYMRAVVLTILALLLFGCGGGSSHAHVEHPYNYTPELYSFDMLDSYDTDTGYSSAPLALNPYEYYGLFELYWSANSLEDYEVNVVISDTPDPLTGTLVHTERCGAGRWCDQGGSFICEYGADLTVSCDEHHENPKDISYLFDTIPQDLYMILQICDLDSNYCEHAYYPVLME